MAKLTIKQQNLVSYVLSRGYILSHLTYEECDKLVGIAYSEVMPEDISVLVGDVDKLQKDEREGVKAEDKKRAVEELRSIIKQYEKHLDQAA